MNVRYLKVENNEITLQYILLFQNTYKRFRTKEKLHLNSLITEQCTANENFSFLFEFANIDAHMYFSYIQYFLHINENVIVCAIVRSYKRLLS
jgi:hypothetical protein